jgi:hypothetical protein
VNLYKNIFLSLVIKLGANMPIECFAIEQSKLCDTDLDLFSRVFLSLSNLGNNLKCQKSSPIVGLLHDDHFLTQSY